MFDLREYQVELKEEIRDNFIKGFRKVILCSPTGSGKTVTFADIARSSILNGARVMIAVDRSELLDQAKSKLISYGLNPSIISSGKEVKQGQKCYVATVQTLVRRVFPDIDLLIIDEAHKQIFDKLLLSDNYKNTFTIGATATPKRSGKMRQLSSIYDKIVQTVDINNLIQKEFLCPAITYGSKEDNSKLSISRGEYDIKEMYNMFNKRTRYAGVVDKYRKFTNNTKAIVFNVNVEHSKKTCKSFNDSGISAVHLDGSMSKSRRESVLDGFKKGLFNVICNVEILTTGYDEPSIETVIINRATKSLPLWLQMCGRGSRTFKNKEHFNIIDMGGNVFEHGFWESERKYSLTHKKRDSLGVAPVKECPITKTDENGRTGCGCIVPVMAKLCNYCDYKFPPPKKEPLKEVEFVRLENYDLLPKELVGRAWGSMSFEELETVKRVKNYKHGWMVRQIIMNRDLDLMEYAIWKKYKNPKAWVDRMERMCIK